MKSILLSIKWSCLVYSVVNMLLLTEYVAELLSTHNNKTIP